MKRNLSWKEFKEYCEFYEDVVEYWENIGWLSDLEKNLYKVYYVDGEIEDFFVGEDEKGRLKSTLVHTYRKIGKNK